MAAWNPEANEIFLKAMEIPSPEDRRAYLDDACRGDDTLRGQVEALIAAGEQAGSFLESPPPGVTRVADSSELSERPGSVIGPYKLLEQIGEGGMGVVFMAEQQIPVRRKVALKLIKPGMDTRQVIARFEAERQALAVMDHPNIARVLDAGATPSGHPFFVMELVRGVPITTYCDESNLPVRERLELFASVCQAIQHAHTKGIIHRDIKPTNVLVTRQDGRATVKVIDFGVAKAMGQQLTEKTLFTNFAQMIGTPLYMSPEQAERSGVDIDTRSDVYSLGVLLYELLTGSTPVDAAQLQHAAFDEIRRIIREEDPPTPSARISGSQTLPAIAAHRHTEPARLSKLVRGELDWIAMKALEKDRNRRYETANAFAADVLHYLNDEHVLACPPSAAYRFRKFARRNRVAITTATLVAAALVLGTIVSTWQAIRAETARTAEAEQRQIAEEARSAEVLQRKVAEAERSEAEKHRAAAEANYQKAKAAVDKYFTLVSESKLFEVPGLQPLRKDLLESALEFYEGAAVERSSDPAVLADMAVTHLRMSSIYLALDRADDFIAAIRRALDVIDRLRRDHAGASDHERKLAGFWKGMRWTRVGMAVPRDGLAAFQTMFRFEATWQQLANKYPSDVAFQSDLSYVQATIGSGFTSTGRIKEGTAYFRKSLVTSEKAFGKYPDVPQYRSGLAELLQLLANNLIKAGDDPDEALKMTRRAVQLGEGLVAEFPNIPTYRSDLVVSLTSLGEQIAKDQPQAAEQSLSRALELAESLVREFPDYQTYVHVWARAVTSSASCNRSFDDASQAEAVIQKVTDAFEAQMKIRPNDRWVREQLLIYCHTSAEQLSRQGNLTALAERLHRRAAETGESLVLEFFDQPDFRNRWVAEIPGHSYRYLGWIARDTGRPDEALQDFDKAAALFQKLVDAKVPQKDGYYRDFLADTLLQKVGILAGAGRADEAEKTSRQVVEIYESLARDFPNNADYLQKSARSVHDLAIRLAARGDHTQAEATIRQAIDEFDKLAAAHPAVPDYQRLRAACQRQLAQIQASSHRKDEAERSYLEAIASYQTVITDFPKYGDLWRVYDGLAQALAAINRFDQAEEACRKMVELAPNDAGALNNLAWQSATTPDPRARKASLAVELATKGIQLDPKSTLLPNTLGVAHYRAGNWQEAIEWLTKSMGARNGGDSFDWFFLAMAHWQLGNKDEARKWHAKAVEWMNANRPKHHELLRFRAEAEELMKEVDKDNGPASEAKAQGQQSH
ncbi:MAG: protein kinase [Planctomycetia bacterium]|nr:protein kinase [Planctomycetia bacterium]